MKIYLAKSNLALHNTLANTRSILKEYGEVIEFTGGNWKEHEPILETCDCLVLVGSNEPFKRENVLIGRGLYATIETFCQRFTDGWAGGVIYAVESPQWPLIEFYEVQKYALNDSGNWSTKYGKLSLEEKPTEFHILIEGFPIPDPKYVKPVKSVFV